MRIVVSLSLQRRMLQIMQNSLLRIANRQSNSPTQRERSDVLVGYNRRHKMLSGTALSVPQSKAKCQLNPRPIFSFRSARSALHRCGSSLVLFQIDTMPDTN